MKGFDAFKKLIDAEKEYANFHIQAATQNPTYTASPAFLAFQQYGQMENARRNYFQTEVGKTRTRRAAYYFSKLISGFLYSQLLHITHHTTLYRICALANL